MRIPAVRNKQLPIVRHRLIYFLEAQDNLKSSTRFRSLNMSKTFNDNQIGPQARTAPYIGNCVILIKNCSNKIKSDKIYYYIVNKYQEKSLSWMLLEKMYDSYAF